MSVTTNVPSITFQSTGIVLPEEADILTGVEADLNAAFGGNLSQSLSSPQGQLAQSLTAIIGDSNDTFAYIVNQIDPSNASGSFQDAIGRIYFQTRKAGTSTTVTCECTGVPGTLIPVGSYAKDGSGYTYSSVADATIPDSGVASVSFQNTTAGAISCAANTVVNIVTAVLGWDAINNASAGVVGSVEESQQDFEFRRLNTVAVNSRSTSQAIAAGLYNLSGVTDVYVQANPTNSATTYGSTNYSIPAHSVYVAVCGGDSEDIGQSLFATKDLGTNTVGNTSVTVYDTYNYNYPYPSYILNYNVPTTTPLYFSINLAANSNLPYDIVNLVKSSVLSTFNSSTSSGKTLIGSSIYASSYYAGISALSQYANITSITVGTSANPTTTSVTMGIDQVPSLSVSNITVSLV